MVGKSSLVFRFFNYAMPKNHDPTIEDRYQTTITIKDRTFEIEILDTAGEEDFQNMLDMWISFGDGFLLVFALNDIESFEEIKVKRDRIIKSKKEFETNPNFILVGNKVDLEDQRKVSFNEAKSLADSWGCEYIETSAKTNINCKTPFEKVAALIIEKRLGSEFVKGKCCNIF